MDSTNDLEVYLKPTTAINSDNKAVCQIALELKSLYSDQKEMARALFYYVRDQIHYSVYMISTRFEDFLASTVLERKKDTVSRKQSFSLHLDAQ